MCRIGIGRAAEAGLDLPVVEGPHGVLPHADHRLGNVLADPVVRVRHELIHAGERLRVDDDLGIGRVGIFRADGQVEPRRPLADEGADGRRGRMRPAQYFSILCRSALVCWIRVPSGAQ